jgi:hypothetical protein
MLFIVTSYTYNQLQQFTVNDCIKAWPHGALRTLCSLYEQKNISFYWQCDWPRRVPYVACVAYVTLCVAAALDSLHFFLDYECLLFQCDEWRAKKSLATKLNSSFVMSRRTEYRSPSETVCLFLHVLFLLLRNVCQTHGKALISTSIFVAVGTCLPNRYLAMVMFITICICIFVDLYNFVSPFREAKFCGVRSYVFHRCESAAGDRKLTGPKYRGTEKMRETSLRIMDLWTIF